MQRSHSAPRQSTPRLADRLRERIVGRCGRRDHSGRRLRPARTAPSGSRRPAAAPLSTSGPQVRRRSRRTVAHASTDAERQSWRSRSPSRDTPFGAWCRRPSRTAAGLHSERAVLVQNVRHIRQLAIKASGPACEVSPPETKRSAVCRIPGDEIRWDRAPREHAQTSPSWRVAGGTVRRARGRLPDSARYSSCRQRAEPVRG